MIWPAVGASIPARLGGGPGPANEGTLEPREGMLAGRLQSGDQLAEGQGVAHLVCTGKWTRDVESLAFEQAPGSRVVGTGDGGEPTDPRNRRKASDQGGNGGGTDALPSRGWGKAVADLDAALAVGRAVGPDVTEDLSVSAAGDEPDGRQDGCQSGESGTAGCVMFAFSGYGLPDRR